MICGFCVCSCWRLDRKQDVVSNAGHNCGRNEAVTKMHQVWRSQQKLSCWLWWFISHLWRLRLILWKTKAEERKTRLQISSKMWEKETGTMALKFTLKTIFPRDNISLHFHCKSTTQLGLLTHFSCIAIVAFAVTTLPRTTATFPLLLVQSLLQHFSSLFNLYPVELHP